MTQQKPHSIKKLLAKLGLFGLVMVTLISVLIIGPMGVHKASAATYTDCSDVFTPLSASVTNGVNANKGFYVQAMNETGVPWEMLAAIHYRETNFSHTNPSNGQGIFQFVSGNGGPYPAGPVSNDEFYRQLKYMATQVQSVYTQRNTPNAANVTPRALTADEQDINLIKNTLYSYNGRSTEYANQGSQYGYNPSSQPYEGSPYVMNRFDCPRARMGTITQDYGSIDSTDTRYGTFTIFARLRGDSYWLAMTQAYSWILNSQELYSDPARTASISPDSLASNGTYYARVVARNIGSSTWTNTGSNPVLLGVSGEHNSTVCEPSTWVGCNRPAALKEASVAPGQLGTFEFSVKAPANNGIYREYFNLVAEGKAWFNDIGMYYPFGVHPPSYTWSLNGQGVYYDSARTKAANLGTLAPNTSYYVRIQARNTGNVTWTNTGSNPVLLGMSGERMSSFCDSSTWIGCNRPAALKESTVLPGQVGTFEFILKSPNAFNAYKEYFNIVSEGKAWFNDIGMHLPLTTRPPTAEWQYAGQAAYTDSSKNTSVNTTQLSNGARIYVTLNALNTGNTTWTNTGNNPVLLGATNPTDRSSTFCDPSWISCNRPAALEQASVAPGNIGTLSFWMKAPYGVNGTHYNEYFKPVVEGSMWMNDVGLYWPITLQTSLTSWQYMGQSAYSDAAHTQPIDLTSASVNKTYYLQLKLKNTSGGMWTNANSAPLRLGTSSNNPYCDASWIGDQCNRPSLVSEASIAPGQIGTFNFSIRTPASPTNTNLAAAPVIDGVRWLDDIGLYWPISTH